MYGPLRCLLGLQASLLSIGLLGLLAPSPAHAGAAPDRKGGTELPDSAPAATSAAVPTEESAEIPTIDVFEGLRSRKLAVKAEGTGDGKMTLTLTNKTTRKLRVVLPPGLIATGATGQFGGMGGMMGGMGGGMGMMGGGMMGGMGGGMGGMGGMGGGMGMMGGGMRGGMMGGRGMMGGGTMPASMGMMMLGRLIMTLVGERDSWNMMSLMSGMMGGMGMMGGGMGMMGGGMGMMGGGMGMMGGMGGGFRSVPPTSLPQTTLKPRETKHLPTVAVSLDGPGDANEVKAPAKGEPLRIGSIDRFTKDGRAQRALKRLAAEKAPRTVSQLVLWNVAAGLDWTAIDRLSQRWANPHELALARQFVARLGETDPAGDTGVLYWNVTAEGSAASALAAELSKQLEKSSLLGLKTQRQVPASPGGAALACRVTITGPRVDVQASASDERGEAWVPLGTFSLKLPADRPEPKLKERAAQVGDAIAAGVVGKVVRARLARGPRVKGKETYRIQLENASPLVLNGIGVAGPEAPEQIPFAALGGLSVPPHKGLTLPASAEMVEKLHLKKGVRVVAADLSGL